MCDWLLPIFIIQYLENFDGYHECCIPQTHSYTWRMIEYGLSHKSKLHLFAETSIHVFGC